MCIKWGVCNIEVKCIWFNLELVKKLFICLEYIIVYELVYLFEWYYNDCFVVYMDRFMFKWWLYWDQLNELLVVYEDWGY